jgi:F0F1-type ATP synthase assembly protein I
METTEQNENDPLKASILSEDEDQDENTFHLGGNWQDDRPDQPEEPFVIQRKTYEPVSAEETGRRSGLAWSAGIVFFTSIAFMLFLGWIADVLLGSSPWGLVGGIVLGSIIGFIQFFRISSQIFEKPNSPASPKTLFKDNDDSR